MKQNKPIRRHSDEFKKEAVDLVIKQGYSVPKAAQALGIASGLLYRWKNS